jgi:hypothetical protein
MASRAAKKTAAANKAALEAQSKANSNMKIPEVAEPPSAEEILAAYRNEIIGNFDAYKGIASKASAADSETQKASISSANPEYYGLQKQLNTNAEALNQGVLPDDVVQQVNSRANQNSYLRGFTTGQPGSGGNAFAGANSAGANLLLRNLGLTSLDAMKLGSNLTGQIQQEARAAAAPITKVASVLPGTGMFQTAAENQASFNQALYNRDAAVNNQGVQSNYLNDLAGTTGLTGDATSYAALSGIFGGVANAGMGYLANNYTAGQTLGGTGAKKAGITPYIAPENLNNSDFNNSLVRPTSRY